MCITITSVFLVVGYCICTISSNFDSNPSQISATSVSVGPTFVHTTLAHFSNNFEDILCPLIIMLVFLYKYLLLLCTVMSLVLDT